MKKYIIMTDSTTDLPNEYAIENNLHVIPLGFSIDGKNYANYLDNRELSSEDFYAKIRGGSNAKTFQINPETFYTEFKKVLDNGYGILGIFFSSGLSGTFNSARIAYEKIKEEDSNAEIKIIDSLAASLGEGLLVHYAVKAKNNNLTLAEAYQYVESLKMKIAHWFTVMDMDTLKRGGRVSAASAFFAKTLNIHPVLHVSNEGKLIARTKKIGRKSALNALVDKFLETYIEDLNDVIFISHSQSYEDALKVANAIKEKSKIEHVMINDIGPVIGGHCGIGTIALFFVAKER